MKKGMKHCVPAKSKARPAAVSAKSTARDSKVPAKSKPKY